MCALSKEVSKLQVVIRLIDIVDKFSCVTLHFFNFGFFFKLSTPSLPTLANSLFDLVFRAVDNAGAGWNLSGFAGFFVFGVATFGTSFHLGMPELLHLAILENETGRTTFVRLS